MTVITKMTYFLAVTVIVFVLSFLICLKFLYNDRIRFIYDNDRHLLLNGTGCTIPDLDPFDPSIKHLIFYDNKVDCKENPGLIYQRDNWVYVNATVIKLKYERVFSHCESDAIVRVNNNSDELYYFFPHNGTFNKHLHLTSEFTRIRCYDKSPKEIFYDFYARNIPKEKAERRYKKYFTKHVEKNAVKSTFNVLIVGIDSVSRLNFIRHLPETRAFLLSELGAVEMTVYHKVEDNTFGNVVPIFTGKYVQELPYDEYRDIYKPFDSFDMIFKRYAKAGYRTLYAEDDPYISTFNYLKEGFWTQPVDDYIRPMSLAMEAEESIWSSERYCVHERCEHDIFLDYVYRFVEANIVADRPYFAYTFLTRVTHEWMNDAVRADTPHVNFLRRLHSAQLLNNTVMLYFSDHGMRYGDIRNTYIGKMSARLPAMYVYVPPKFKRVYSKLYRNLLTNSHRLTTPFDIYETLLDLLNFNDSVGRKAGRRMRGVSLFSKILNRRTCHDAEIAAHWCACGSQKNVSVNESIVILAAQLLVEKLNLVLKPTSDVCSLLKLRRIIKAVIITTNNEMLTYEEENAENFVEFQENISLIHHYQVNIETDPGGGRFEGTLKYDMKDKSLKLTGGISRTNLYAKSSACVKEANLRKYCFCRVQQ